MRALERKLSLQASIVGNMLQNFGTARHSIDQLPIRNNSHRAPSEADWPVFSISKDTVRFQCAAAYGTITVLPYY